VLARHKAYSAINYAQIEANWLIGQRIMEQEQHGQKRAEYGKNVIKLASEELTKEFGKGFSERTLRQFRQFYVMFPEILNSANSVRQISEKHFHFLTWSHIQRIMRIENRQTREWYLKETAENMWDFRTLDRNVSTLYHERLLSSQIKEPVVKEMEDKTAIFQNDKFAFIKNPTVLEFLGLPDNNAYVETELEQAIINQMQKFLLELGKGFAFVDRQQLIRTETQDFYIDLVFYNFILKCFVIIELKTDKITHQDIGQLDMYVRMYDDLKKNEGDNPTVGILLCTQTDNTIAKYSVLKENKQLFASKYMSYLPTEEELKAEIERQKEFLASKFE
jgi:predicted nuclease of restriction endonuclease-like (RecB) superfamily